MIKCYGIRIQYGGLNIDELTTFRSRPKVLAGYHRHISGLYLTVHLPLVF